MLPVEEGARRAAAAAKGALAAGAGGASDHLALVRAYNGWNAARALGRERAYAVASFVSGATLNMVHGMRAQLLAELQACALASLPPVHTLQILTATLISGHSTVLLG